MMMRKRIRKSDNCHICGKTILKHNLKLHLQTHNPNENNANCNICNKQLSKNSMAIHLKMHIENNISSQSTGYKYSLVLRQLSNVETNTKSIGETKKKFKCSECDKYFRVPGQLKHHMEAVHLKIRKHVCHICDKAFTDPTPLRYHVQKHMADPNRKFKCSICEKSFLIQQNVRDHMSVECHGV